MPICDQCKTECDEVYRLVMHPESGYDAMGRPPKFLCKECSVEKCKELKERGYEIDPEKVIG